MLQARPELVRRARAPRRAHAHQGARGARRPGRHVRGHARLVGAGRGRARGARCGRGRRRRAALVQQPRVPGHDLRRQPPRCGRDADQLASGCARAALHPRALGCAGAGVWPRTGRPRRRRDSPTLDGDLARVRIGDDVVVGWERFSDLRADGPPPARAPEPRPTTSTGSCTRRARRDDRRARCSPTPTWRGRTSRTSPSSASPPTTSASRAGRCTTWARSTSSPRR